MVKNKKVELSRPIEIRITQKKNDMFITVHDNGLLVKKVGMMKNAKLCDMRVTAKRIYVKFAVPWDVMQVELTQAQKDKMKEVASRVATAMNQSDKTAGQ